MSTAAKALLTLGCLGAAALPCLAAVTGTGPAVATGLELVVIAHPQVPQEELTLEEWRSLFRGDRPFWRGNQRVDLLVPPKESPEREVLLQQTLLKTETSYTRHWRGQRVRGTADTEPREMPSGMATTMMVRKSYGAVGLVRRDEVPPVGVKVLRIDGKLPGDENYPLGQ